MKGHDMWGCQENKLSSIHHVLQNCTKMFCEALKLRRTFFLLIQKGVFRLTQDMLRQERNWSQAQLSPF